jgi:hypothetical protein
MIQCILGTGDSCARALVGKCSVGIPRLQTQPLVAPRELRASERTLQLNMIVSKSDLREAINRRVLYMPCRWRFPPLSCSVLLWEATCCGAVILGSLQDGLGKQILSEKCTAPRYGVGTEQRKSLAIKNGVPGPGLYKVHCHNSAAHDQPFSSSLQTIRAHNACTMATLRIQAWYRCLHVDRVSCSTGSPVPWSTSRVL